MLYFNLLFAVLKVICLVFSRILTGKEHRQIKLWHLQKVPIWTFLKLVHKIDSLLEVLKQKENFQKSSYWQCSFLKKDFVFQKIRFKVKVLKTFKIATDCYIKTCRSLKRRVILKIPSIAFQKNLCSFCWLQNETSTKNPFPVLRQKPPSNFAVKLAERSNHSFLLPT